MASKVKLGRLKSRPDRLNRTLKLSKYLTPALPPPPPKADYGKAVNPHPGFLRTRWKMLGNDSVGNCVLAAAAHLEMQWNWNVGDPFIPTTSQVNAAYSAITGYDGSPDSDVGTEPMDALKYWRNTGICDQTIEAFVATNARDWPEILHSINLFEGAYIALSLPVAAQRMDDWDIPEGQDLSGIWTPYSWGGHMVEACAYDGDWLTIVSWGDEKRVSRRFMEAFCDESYAIISKEMFGDQGKTPLGFDLATLQADLALVTA